MPEINSQDLESENFKTVSETNPRSELTIHSELTLVFQIDRL